MTPEELAQAVTDAGITTQQLIDLLRQAGLMVQRERINKAIEKARADQAAADAQYESEIQTLTAQLSAINGQILAAFQ
jgi:hypothetical protein